MEGKKIEENGIGLKWIVIIAIVGATAAVMTKNAILRQKAPETPPIEHVQTQNEDSPVDKPTVQSEAEGESTISRNASNKSTINSAAKSSYSSPSSYPDDYDNMRGFDPASEDDMPDNGMTRYRRITMTKAGTDFSSIC